MIEVRWHGRAGQGAKTVSHLLAVAALDSGSWVQAFPEYGPERSGAPMQAYNRLDGAPIRRRSPVTHPDAVVVLDASLLKEIDVAAGLGADGLLIVNADESPVELRTRVRFGGRLLLVSGDRLAQEAGARHSNVVLLGALARALGAPTLEALERAVRETMAAPRFAPTRQATLKALASGYEVGAAVSHAPAGSVQARTHCPFALPRANTLPQGAVVTPGTARRLTTGGWRSGRKPRIDLGVCVNCLLCWLACPDCAIEVTSDSRGVRLSGFDYGVCKGCELCVEVCPVGAIGMVADDEPLPADGHCGCDGTCACLTSAPERAT